jgi:hypothetical protein
MKKLIYLGLVFSCLSSPLFLVGQNNYFVEAEYLGQSSSIAIDFVSPLPANYNVDYYKIIYNTIDPQGEPTIASGALAVPVSNECNIFPMFSYCHGTVLRQNDVPSAQNFESTILLAASSAGFITVAPDYIGLGEDEGIHPYVHGESQATATIDLIRAVREYFETQDFGDNGEVFITGYSQGGHASMATLKYAEENGLNEELGIVAGAPLSGPYNMSGTQTELLLSDEPYSNPGYVIYLLISYNFVYGNLFEDLGDVVQSPYDELVAPYFDGAQDQFNMGVVNALLPNNLSDLLQDSTLTNFENNLNHPLRMALADNDNYDWLPQVPLRIYYCDADEQVNFQNSLDAEIAMNQNGAEDVSAINIAPGEDHGGCVIPAISATYAFFDSLATPCSSTLAVSYQEDFPLKVFPNPVSHSFRVEAPIQTGVLTLHDLQGKMILQENLLNRNYDISQLPAGVYIITVQGDTGFFRTALVKD